MATYPNGVDFSTFARGDGQPDLDPNFLPIDGERAVLEHIARRLITPPGSWHNPSYGFDIRTYLNAALLQGDGSSLEAAARNEALQVEGVDSVDTTSVVDSDARAVRLTLSVTLLDSEKPFDLVFELSESTLPKIYFPS